MAHPSTQPAESFSPTEARVQGGDHHLASVAADVYSPKDSAYSTVFRATASSDKLKTDAQLNAELFNAPSPYGDTTAKVNPADRNDNAISTNSKNNTAWDPYESLTLNLKGPVNAPERNDNAIVANDTPAPGGNTAWDPYESLSLNLRGPSNDGIVNPPERNANAVANDTPAAGGNTAWDPYESLTLNLRER
ncbi:MAG: hypothetical protein JST89_21610 [Cyanobacteria bacterium SZAS-4]|nr:hypothetical protein [Cyanobacteria bacterium SZAS-4]